MCYSDDYEVSEDEKENKSPERERERERKKRGGRHLEERNEM